MAQTPADVAREYDRLADRFAAWRPSAQFTAVFNRAVIGRLKDRGRGPVTVLDAGCGHGTWLKRVVDYSDAIGLELRATGVDISEQRLALARKEFAGRPNIDFICGNLQDLILPACFDLIYSAEVFQHLTSRQQALLLARWRTVLAPRGAIVIIDKERYSWHSVKIEMQKRFRAVGRWAWRSIPSEYAGLFATIRYPSFDYLAQTGKRLGFEVGEPVTAGEFTGLPLVAPADPADPD